MFSTRRLRVVAGLAVSALVAVVAVSAGTSANTQSAKLVIWADADRVPAVTQVANAWAQIEGRDRSGRPEGARTDPLAAHDRRRQTRHRTSSSARTTGSASSPANGSILPLSPSAATKKQFPAYALNAFSYGTAHQEALRHAGRTREHRADHEHEAREGADVVRRPREAGARGEEEDEGAGRTRGPAGSGETRTTCTRSSRASAATSSDRTRQAISTRRTSVSRTRSS